MELHEEYLTRRAVKSPCVKYVDKANLILRAKSKNCEWSWLHVNISGNGDTGHPPKYTFTVSGNPTLYSTNDLSHFAQHSKTLDEKIWEWEQYESGIVNFCKDVSGKYRAIRGADAVYVAWEMFTTNYDAWMAHFLPYRIQEEVYRSLRNFVDDEVSRQEKNSAIKMVEECLKEKFERVHVCWKNIKGAIEQRHYADWLAKIVNDLPG